MKTVQFSLAAAKKYDAKRPGYSESLEQAASSRDGDVLEVPAEAVSEILKRHDVKPTQGRQKKRRRIALGDAVESMLTRIGITKELVQRLTRTKDCGCKARQRWLNQWGYARQAQVERIVEKAARWYGIT